MRNVSSKGNLRLQAERLGEIMFAIGRKRGLRDPIVSNLEGEQFTPPQIHALMWLGHDDTLTMGELARMGGVTEKTITGVIDRMEKARLLHRERNENDRRVVRVRLTAKGAHAFEQLHECIFDRIATLLSLLDERDRSDLFRILERIRERLGDLEPKERG
jgi:DNA-binding MarR family transcriptional regulator